ncbi:uncharacterized protein LOC134196940 isoform X2 [Corticium candelabrum]|uniref:uncharacterized protein LOC134196940 isoform X2 n=1 Tax=Corticium candelabrum TaxID=121492 RepID=UPI002E25D9F3|nr:uncharacterized protein LOC134196940 isoform X2 [Corticium candelabrum]
MAEQQITRFMCCLFGLITVVAFLWLARKVQNVEDMVASLSTGSNASPSRPTNSMDWKAISADQETDNVPANPNTASMQPHIYLRRQADAATTGLASHRLKGERGPHKLRDMKAVHGRKAKRSTDYEYYTYAQKCSCNKGEKGSKGDRGRHGEEGFPGPRGQNGHRGRTGLKGDKGDTAVVQITPKHPTSASDCLIHLSEAAVSVQRKRLQWNTNSDRSLDIVFPSSNQSCLKLDPDTRTEIEVGRAGIYYVYTAVKISIIPNPTEDYVGCTINTQTNTQTAHIAEVYVPFNKTNWQEQQRKRFKFDETMSTGRLVKLVKGSKLWVYCSTSVEIKPDVTYFGMYIVSPIP